MTRSHTFLDGSKIRGLPIGEDRFHVNAHVPSRTVRTADDTETESFVPRTLQKSGRQYREWRATLAWPRQGAESRLFALASLVDVFEFGVGIQAFVRVLCTLKKREGKKIKIRGTEDMDVSLLFLVPLTCQVFKLEPEELGILATLLLFIRLVVFLPGLLSAPKLDGPSSLFAHGDPGPFE